jgi:hypothetical protein
MYLVKVRRLTRTLESLHGEASLKDAQTTVIPGPSPTYISVDGATGDISVPPAVNWGTPTAFQYQDATATGVDITLHFSDGTPDITALMTGTAPTWTYTVTFLNSCVMLRRVALLRALMGIRRTGWTLTDSWRRDCVRRGCMWLFAC